MEVSQEQVHSQLDTLFRSPDFTASTRLKDFLRYVCNETLQGRGNQIKAYSIAVAVFGRPDNFDPMLDPIVRVEAGKLRKLLEHYYLIHTQDQVIIQIPIGTYIPVFTPGNPGSASWATDLESILKIDTKSVGGGPVQEKRPLLLLVPPVNLSGNQEYTQLSMGLVEDMLMYMRGSKKLDIRVVPSSCREEDEYLNAAHTGFIIHGQIQATQSQVRVYITLTSAKDNTRLWTEKYSHPIESLDILEFQEHIARRASALLMDSYGVISQYLMREVSYLSSSEIDPYDASLYSKIWDLTLDRTNFNRALQAEEFGLKADPYNPHLMAELSRLYTADYQYAFNQMPDNLDVGLDLAKLAIARDKDALTAHLAVAHNLFVRGRKLTLKERIKLTLEMDYLAPHVYCMLGFFTGMALDLERGMELMKQGFELNPVQPGYFNIVPFIYHFKNGDYELALRESIQLNAPTNVWDPILRILIYTKLEQPEVVKKACRNLYYLEPMFADKVDQILTSTLFDPEHVRLVKETLDQAQVFCSPADLVCS